MASKDKAMGGAGAIQMRVEWKKVSSREYKTAPHEWIKRERPHIRLWDELAKIIKAHGETREWRGGKYKYLLVGGYAYWCMWFIINRTYVAALDNSGYPNKEQRKRIFKRFWG